eukprot:3471084-Rhodomonas_salina.1
MSGIGVRGGKKTRICDVKEGGAGNRGVAVHRARVHCKREFAKGGLNCVQSFQVCITNRALTSLREENGSLHRQRGFAPPRQRLFASHKGGLHRIAKKGGLSRIAQRGFVSHRQKG